jgi:DNA-binding NtrC family response regulator
LFKGKNLREIKPAMIEQYKAKRIGVSRAPATRVWRRAREKDLTDREALSLQQYSWPGNIRGLQNVIEKLKSKPYCARCVAQFMDHMALPLGWACLQQPLTLKSACATSKSIFSNSGQPKKKNASEMLVW